MNKPMLTEELMYKALVEKDASYEGLFFVGVKTTGIFCRPTCTARKPKRENVEFFKTAKDAILHGYRSCKVCFPLERAGETPNYIRKILNEVNNQPDKKLKDYDLRSRGIGPAKISRWFKKNHGMTFHSYQRLLRINTAFKKIQMGESITAVAYGSGYESLSGFNDTFKSVLGVSPSGSKAKVVINFIRLETPLGPMIACAVEQGICLLEFNERRMLETEFKTLTKLFDAPILLGENTHFSLLRQQLNEYFEGMRKEFTLPLVMPGTAFQQQVWNALRQIPYGGTLSYQQQANVIKNPKAVRAVALANGMNRIAIVVPCHRVIGSDGNLTGYGGGIWRKKWLLELEQEHKQTQQSGTT